MKDLCDGKNVPVTSYSLGRVKVGNLSDPLPPLNVQAQPQNGNIVIQWSLNPANSSVAGYKIFYTDIGQVGTFDQQISVGNISSFTLTNLQAGKTYRIALSAFDSNGNSSVLSKTSTVALPTVGGNSPPQIKSTPPTEATEGNSYQYQVQATDPDGGNLAYSFGQAPTGASITSGGLITWTPGAADVGEQKFIVVAKDGFGGSDTQEFAVQVSALPIQTATGLQPSSLSVALLGQGTGTVTSTPSGIDCGVICSKTYANGTVVTLAALPSSNSTFEGWSGDSDCADGQVTMNGPRTCAMTFNLASSSATALNLTAKPRSLPVGSSTIVTASVLANGNPVDNGTLVTFTTTLGNFSNGNKSINVFTSGGIATVSLTSTEVEVATVQAMVGTGTPSATVAVFFNKRGISVGNIIDMIVNGKQKAIYDQLNVQGLRRVTIDSRFGNHRLTVVRYSGNPVGVAGFDVTSGFFDRACKVICVNGYKREGKRPSNSMAKRFSARFQWTIGRVHRLDACWIAK